MPVTAIVQPAETIGRPSDDVGDVAGQGLLASGTQVAAARVPAGHPAHEPFTVGVALPALQAAQGSPEIEFAVVASAAVGPGHGSIIASRPKTRSTTRPLGRR